MTPEQIADQIMVEYSKVLLYSAEERKNRFRVEIIKILERAKHDYSS